MQTVFEYLGASLILFLTVSAAFVLMSNMSNVSLDQTVQGQIQILADRTLDKLTATAGSPADWATNTSSTMQDFGLALGTGSSSIYDLDPYKLEVAPTLTPVAISKALGFYSIDHYVYGFKFTLQPALNVSVTSSFDNVSTLSYTFNVTDYRGLPCRNALVNLTFVPTTSAGNVSITAIPQYSAVYTDWNGMATKSYTYSPGLNDTSYTLEATISYLGIRQSYTAEAEEGLQNAGILVNFVGNQMIVTFNPAPGIDGNGQDNGQRKVGQDGFNPPYIIVLRADGSSYTIYVPTQCPVHNNGPSQTCTLALPPDPTAVAIIVPYRTTGNSRQHFTAGFPGNSQSLFNFSLGFGSPPTMGGTTIVTDGRLVTAGSLTYYSSLTIWRMFG